MEGVETRHLRPVEVREHRAEHGVEEVMGVGLALSVSEQRSGGAVAASDSVSQLEVAKGRGRVDGIVVVEGENCAEWAVNLSCLIGLAA